MSGKMAAQPLEKWITPTTTWQQVNVPENVSRLTLDSNFYLHVNRLQK